MLGFLGVDNLHKKFRDDILKIADFFIMSNFWWYFFVFKRIKKERNDHQKLDIRKKSTIFKISFQNFLCKLSTPRNPNTPVLEKIIKHLVA